MRIILPLILFLFLSPGAQQPFKNSKEALDEFEKMYGDSDSTAQVREDWRNEFTSISKFMECVTTRPRERIFLLYTDDDQLGAVKVLRTFLGRKRGCSVVDAETNKSRIYLVKTSEVDFASIRNYKSLLFSTGSDHLFIKRMAEKGKVKVSSNKAQFRLFAKPNTLAFVCQDDDMVPELVRVFIRSYRDFDDENYSYFYIN